MAIEQQVLPATASRRKVLTATCGAHAVHDGYTDTLLLLLPLWRASGVFYTGTIGAGALSPVGFGALSASLR